MPVQARSVEHESLVRITLVGHRVVRERIFDYSVEPAEERAIEQDRMIRGGAFCTPE